MFNWQLFTEPLFVDTSLVGKKTGSVLVISSLYKLRMFDGNGDENISTCCNFWDGCFQFTCCYFGLSSSWVMWCMFLSFLSKSDVIFRSHLPNMIDCTVAVMTTTPLHCTQNPSQNKTQMPWCQLPKPNTKNTIPSPTPKPQTQKPVASQSLAYFRWHSDQITSGSDNLAILSKLGLAHINPFINSLLIRVLLLILVIEQWAS